MDFEQARYMQIIPNPAFLQNQAHYPGDELLRDMVLEQNDFDNFFIELADFETAIEAEAVPFRVMNGWGAGNSLETLRYLNRMHDYNRLVPNFAPTDPLPTLNEVADVFRLPYMEGNVGEFLDPDINGEYFFDAAQAPIAAQPVIGGALGGNIGAAQPPAQPPAHVVVGQPDIRMQR
jgi:hypothetical protein